MFAAVILLAVAIGCVHSQTELVLPPLPYAYTALEPVLSEHLMRLHHDKHFQTYMNKTNGVLRAMVADTQHGDKLKEIAKLPIEVILTQLQSLPDQYHLSLRHNGGGYLNHKLFFTMLKTPTATAVENRPTGPLFEAIEKSFGSFDKFKELFSVASANLFGSGWVWLYIDARTKQLVLNFTANQDNP
jgi:Fe-Mn family superoxide dismutase